MVPVSLTVPQFTPDPEPLFTLARQAGSYGLRGLFAFDHLVPLGDARRPVLELTSTLGALAALAQVGVGSMVLRVTLRPPEVSAAVATTLSAIAPGRSVIGLGIGDSLSADEARRFGQTLAPLDGRLAELGATIAAVRAAAPSVPIWVGGRHRRVRELAARLADGWNAWGAEVGPLAEEAAEVRELAGGRAFTVSWGGTLLLAPDQSSLEKQISSRGGSEGAVAGTPPVIKRHLEAVSQVVDEIVVSVVPNRPRGWELMAGSVLSG